MGWLRRRGLASVEYAMSLPILLFLFVTIISTGYVSIGRIRAGVDARAQAWKDRENQRTGKPLYFSPPGGENALVVTKTRDVKVSKLNGGKVTVRSTLAVNGGSWDWRDVDPAKFMDTTMTMIFSLPTSAVGDFQSVLSQLGNISQTLGGAAASMADGANQTNSQIDQMRQQAKQKNDQKRKELDQKLSDAQQHLAAAQKTLKQDQDKQKALMDQLTEAQKIKDAKQRQMKIDAINQQLQPVNAAVMQDQKQVNYWQNEVNKYQTAKNSINNIDP
jgi:hypothetical protein